MALKPSVRYPAQTDTDAAYPLGKARNAGSFQDGTGTPLEKDWVNDIFGFEQALLDDAGITPSEDPDEVGASQYLDAVKIVASTVSELKALPGRALRLRLQTTAAAFISDSGAAVVSGWTPGHTPLLLKGGSNSVVGVGDADVTVPTGTINFAGGLQVTGAARNGHRILAVGILSSRAWYSTDQGITWNIGSSLAASANDVIYSVPHSRFMVTHPTGSSVSHDVDGASTWAAVSTGLDTDTVTSIAALGSGTVVAMGYSGGHAQPAVSTDGGVSWSVAGGTLPDVFEYFTDAGWVVGDGGDTIYHAGTALGGTVLRVCSSTDGDTWNLIKEFVSPGAGVGNHFDQAAKTRILLCPMTGLLVVVSELVLSNSSIAYASLNGGLTWSEPAVYGQTIVPAGWGIGNGRLIATQGTNRIYASDGVGGL
jgi:hypothetical protein